MWTSRFHKREFFCGSGTTHSIYSTLWPVRSVLQTLLHTWTPKMIFHIPRISKYENVHRRDNIGKGERHSGAAKLLSRKFILKLLLYIYEPTLQKLQHISKDLGNFCIISKYSTESWLWNNELYKKLCNREQANMDS